eukprot:scaffold224394_cov19-Tisochrysis_lutea.AAC.1
MTSSDSFNAAQAMTSPPGFNLAKKSLTGFGWYSPTASLVFRHVCAKELWSLSLRWPTTSFAMSFGKWNGGGWPGSSSMAGTAPSGLRP